MTYRRGDLLMYTALRLVRAMPPLRLENLRWRVLSLLRERNIFERPRAVQPLPAVFTHALPRPRRLPPRYARDQPEHRQAAR